MTHGWLLGALLGALTLAACGGGRPLQREVPGKVPPPAAKAGGEPRRGGYYQDDGPAATIPDNLDAIPDAEPRVEPLNRGTARPYVVFGKAYTPHTTLKPFKQRGVASWYGKKFHGQKTSSGELYDMFAMTAAHTVLPIPSYVRVTNPATGKSVVVRINDRGPFHADRIIDLSYTAALKLGYIGRGSTAVEIEQIIPGEAEAATYAPLAPPKKPELRVEAAAAPAAGGDELAALIGRLDNASEPLANGGAKPAAGVYLQLGAFGNADNAETLRQHLERELDWIDEGIHVQASPLANGNKIHRVQAGPFASRAAAEKAAERVREAVGSRPAVVSR